MAELLARRLRTVALRADAENIDGWWQRIAPLVQDEILAGQSALARLARGYVVEHARLEGVRLGRPADWQPSPEQVATSLRVTGPVAFREHMQISGSPDASVRTMADRLEGSATRLVLEGHRGTVLRTVQDSGGAAGWRRVAGRPEPCAFCLALVSRGAVYSKATAAFQAHDWCACTPEPLYRHEAEPPEVQDLYRQWRQATHGTSGAASLRAWRAHVDAKRRQGAAA
ncbi:VG15 protein [Streptomyces phytophilus]|uniref:VG15 protein n=1 Tax=Streptomyces phytophilus TaxID=722715 RepID=UPI001C693D7D|nr:hypothetical protein [Streptomyces phytophilus]